MNEQSTASAYLSRGIDYLGNLGAKLRDLRGFATLAYEIIQNADDASGASSMAFDLREEAFVVDNDGTFTGCKHVEQPDCPWLSEESRGHRCDFHRFRLVASGDKREESGTIGAFGIGFLSVYQIADYPQLISAGRHWILQEDQNENERIRVCPGCSICKDKELPRTRFIFPWAKDPDSSLRRSLRAEAISQETASELLNELLAGLPTAMIFLKKINSIQVKRNGQDLKRFERIIEGDSLIIACSGDEDRIWHLLRGNFEHRADELKQKHAGRIETKRSADVTIALPGAALHTGFFCAFLPTQQETSLPFHMNADFFTSNDRKGIILETDYQSEWNRAAINASADALASAFERFPSILGHSQLWATLEDLQKAAQEAKAGLRERTLARFWERLQPLLGSLPIVYSSKAEWQKPAEVFFLLEKEEEAAAPVLEGLNIALVHPALRSHFNMLRSSDIGVRILGISDLARAMQYAGLTHRFTLEQLPPLLKTDEFRQVLYKELETLLERIKKPDERKTAIETLRKCSIARGTDEAFWPCGAVCRADEDTKGLFQQILPSVAFLAFEQEEIPLFRNLCPPFSAAAAVSWLSRTVKQGTEEDLARLKSVPIQKLLYWFESQREEILRTSELKGSLLSLPIFPSATGPRPLSELVLPGDFVDPIGITDVVDLNQLEFRSEFLRDLGVRELTFRSYVADYLSKVFEDDNISNEKKRTTLTLLATRLGEIRDDHAIRRILSEVPVIECIDGKYRKPLDVYIGSDTIHAVLGNDVPVACLAREYHSAIMEFCRWVGVADKPRQEDVLKRIKMLVAVPPNQDSRARIEAAFQYLGEWFIESDEEEPVPPILRSLNWLPARGCADKWFRPHEIFAAFQSYLFESQACFLDMPAGIQQKCSRFMGSLGIPSEPSVTQVVSHLLHCAQVGTVVNREVYRFLRDKPQDHSIERLKGKACIILPNDSYVRPDQVYWGEHPFGRYRYRLGPNLRRYNELFSRLGVREMPEYDDARQVLTEIAAEFGSANRVLDDEAHAVILSCWKLLDGALNDGADEEFFDSLKSLKVVPNRSGVLVPPAHIFFEDRPGLALKFGESLSGIVIARPLEGWRAIVAAGVRFLSAAIGSELVECVDPSENGLLLDRMRSRQQQILRVLAAQNPGDGDISIDAVLDQIRFYAVQNFKIRFSLTVFNRPLLSQPETLPAHFHREDCILYFVMSDTQIPWAALAREVSLALFPKLEPGQLASCIKDILSAESDQAADSVLDELGFPPIQAPTPQQPLEEGYLEDIVEKKDPWEVREQETKPPTELSTPEEALRNLLGPDVPEPAPPPAELVRPTDPAHVSKALKNRKRQQGKLRTYVVPNDGTQRTEDPAITVKQQSVDQAGVDRVVEYEKDRQRYPHVMPLNHPGYDIESESKEGQVLRYIEVKSLAGDWGSLGAGMTKTQFDKATELGDRFWLYVVERADQNNCEIHRIQDPARQVNQFLYDHGWQALSEEVDEVPDEGSE